MTGEEIFNQALVLTYITGILIMLYIGWRDK
jgi:preprotein translocase subunit SecF